MITWEITTRFLDKARKRVSVVAIGTDSADPTNPITVNAIQDALVDTTENRTALWTNIKAHYDIQKAEASAKDTAETDLNSEAKAGLEKL